MYRLRLGRRPAMTDSNDDRISQAAKKVHDAIDFNDSIPAEGKGPLHDLAGMAESVVHAVAETGRDVAETAVIVAMETTDQVQQRYKRRTRITNVIGAGVIMVLLAALVSTRRRP
jgi:hypothetical protein